MRKHILCFLVISIALGGCCAFPGRKPSYWVKRNYSAEEFKRDDYECRRDAELRLGPLPGVASGVLAMMTIGKHYYKECMQAKGYELVEERHIPTQISQSTQQQPSTNDIPVSGSEPYRFMSDVIKSFQICKNATDYMENLRCQDTVCIKSAVLLLAHENRQANATVAKHRDTENDLIRKPVEKFCQGYTSLAQNSEDLLLFLEQEFKRPEEILARQDILSREMKEYGRKNSESWKMLHTATETATWALVGKAETVDEKSASLIITQDEIDQLRSQLRRAFGNRIVDGPKADQSAVDGLAGLLWEFLAKERKPADTK